MAELLAIRATWIRWLPSVAGGLWFLWYWSRHAANWDWASQLPLVLLVSIVTASFAWTFDHVVLVPAVVQCAMWVSKSKSRRWRWLVVSIHVLLTGVLLVSKIFVLNDFWYFWLAPTFCFSISTCVRAYPFLPFEAREEVVLLRKSAQRKPR